MPRGGSRSNSRTSSRTNSASRNTSSNHVTVCGAKRCFLGNTILLGAGPECVAV